MSVSRPVRILLWALLLSGSAGAGAYLAAHSNPLPPQVKDGPSPSPSSSPAVSRSPHAKPVRWKGTMRSTTYHDLYVGGRCTSDWETTLSFEVRPDGTVTGSGRARLTSKGAPCPFPVASAQIGVFDLKVRGELAGGTLRLRLLDAGHRPSAGADDLGGFRETILSSGPRAVLSVPVSGSSAAGKITLKVAGTDRDTFLSTNQLRLRCKRC